MIRTPHALLCAILVVPSASIASAQGADGSRAVRIVVDNDLFALRTNGPADHDYTHGTRIQVASSSAPGWLRALAGRDQSCVSEEARRTGCMATSMELGQEIYTPRLDGPFPIEGERPYAGWLFAELGTHFVSGRRVRTLSGAIGVTGPPSYAEQAQDGIHAILGEHERRGWAHQLDEHVGVQLGYTDRLAVSGALGGARAASLSVGWGARAGSVRSDVHVGAMVRLGARAALAWSPADLERTPASGWYAIAGVRQFVVLHDLFVEGNAMHPGAERRMFVAETTLGIGWRSRQTTLEYRWVRRGREYDAQPVPHAIGSLALTIGGF